MVQLMDESRPVADAIHRARTILCLDLATNVSAAIGKPGDTPIGWSYLLPSTGEDIGWFLDEFVIWLAGVVKEHAPDAIYFEAPILRSVDRLSTVRKLTGLAAFTEWFARRKGIECFEVSNAEVSLYFIGRASFNIKIPGAKKSKVREANRRAKKQAVMDKCRALGWLAEDDDVADALAAWCFVENLLCPGLREISDLFVRSAA